MFNFGTIVLYVTMSGKRGHSTEKKNSSTVDSHKRALYKDELILAIVFSLPDLQVMTCGSVEDCSMEKNTNHCSIPVEFSHRYHTWNRIGNISLSASCIHIARSHARAFRVAQVHIRLCN